MRKDYSTMFKIEQKILLTKYWDMLVTYHKNMKIFTFYFFINLFINFRMSIFVQNCNDI